MHITNIHSRVIPTSALQIAALLETLGGPGDLVWPHEDWWPMRLDRPLQMGARGGHGPIRYIVSAHEHAEHTRFDFTRAGKGYHEVFLQDLSTEYAAQCLVTHTISLQPTGKFFFAWHLFVRSIHNALIEDLFDKLQSQFQPSGSRQGWSIWVRLLRRLAKLPAKQSPYFQNTFSI